MSEEEENSGGTVGAEAATASSSVIDSSAGSGGDPPTHDRRRGSGGGRPGLETMADASFRTQQRRRLKAEELLSASIRNLEREAGLPPGAVPKKKRSVSADGISYMYRSALMSPDVPSSGEGGGDASGGGGGGGDASEGNDRRRQLHTGVTTDLHSSIRTLSKEARKVSGDALNKMVEANKELFGAEQGALDGALDGLHGPGNSSASSLERMTTDLNELADCDRYFPSDHGIQTAADASQKPRPQRPGGGGGASAAMPRQIGQFAAELSHGIGRVGQAMTSKAGMGGGGGDDDGSVRTGRTDRCADDGSQFSWDGSSQQQQQPMELQRHPRRSDGSRQRLEHQRQLNRQKLQELERHPHHHRGRFSSDDSGMVVAPVFSRFRRPVLLVAAAAAVICVAGVAVAVSVFGLPGGWRLGGGGDPLPPWQPSQSEDERIDAIRRIIVNSGATAPDLLDGMIFPPTPQYRALMWLAVDDPAMVEPQDERGFFERYALAVFWYSTYGAAELAEGDAENGWTGWTNHTNWMTGRGICSWYGISCFPNGGGEVTYDADGVIKRVNLSSNNVKGTIPPELFEVLTVAHQLDLAGNAISGPIPREIGNMARMQYLNLYSNELTGRLPASVGNLTDLWELDVSNNSLSGPIPETIGQLSKLTLLSMFDNAFTGQIPDIVRHLSKLEMLYLDNNRLTGTVPPSLFNLGKLFDLRLNKNSIGGPIPPQVQSAVELELLYLDENGLTGTIPPSLSRLPRLRTLRLFGNGLTGPLLPDLGNLNLLAHLSVDSNKLSGTIPTEWGQLSHLTELYLHSNSLVGTLPPQLAQLKDLKDLRVHDNGITGEIPTELGGVYRLEHLSLENNRLKGGLPSELGALDRLSFLGIHGNSIKGEVSGDICELRKVSLREFTSDCAGTSPGIVCNCCTECY